MASRFLAPAFALALLAVTPTADAEKIVHGSDSIVADQGTLVVEKLAELAVPLCPKGNIHYTVSFTNNTTDATNAEILDPVPASTTYVEGSAAGGSAFDPATGTVAWEGPVAAGQTVSIGFSVIVDEGTPSPTEIVNEATVRGMIVADPPQPFELQASVPLTVDCPPITVAVSKARELTDPLCPGATIFYTVRMTNTSERNAILDARIEDPIPDGTTFSGSLSPGAVHDEAGQRVSWEGSLLPGETAAMSFSVALGEGLAAGSVITNRAMGTGTDPEVGDGATGVDVVEECGSDLPPIDTEIIDMELRGPGAVTAGEDFEVEVERAVRVTPGDGVELPGGTVPLRIETEVTPGPGCTASSPEPVELEAPLDTEVEVDDTVTVRCDETETEESVRVESRAELRSEDLEDGPFTDPDPTNNQADGEIGFRVQKKKLALVFCYTRQSDRNQMKRPDEDLGEEIPEASKNLADCLKVRDALVASWGFARQDVKVFEDRPETTPASRKVTSEGILDQLGEDGLLGQLEACCDEEGEERRVDALIYLGGHGLPGKFQSSDGTQNLDADDFQTSVQALLDHRCLDHLVVAVDACFAESMLPGFDQLTDKEKLVFGYSSKNNEYAGACFLQGHFNHRWTHAVFKQGVNETIADNFGDQKGTVSVEEAFELGAQRARKGDPGTKDGNPAEELELDPILVDTDEDGVEDSVDLCLYVADPAQKDLDGDGVGDACDLDDDGDEWIDAIDNCPTTPNRDDPVRQRDLDGDGLGDACDDDVDGDGTPDTVDPDDDNDGTPDGLDSCPHVPSPELADTDGDGLGDPCDGDDDGDGVDDREERGFGSDAKSAASRPEFIGVGTTCFDLVDNDADGLVDEEDPDCLDGDGDGVPDGRDTCPEVADAQEDSDGDGIGDACEGGCVPGPTNLCLADGRFAVAVDWETSQGTAGSGQARPLTDDTGWFWFFDPDNVETVVKVLDACPFADRFWVFAAGLTNVAAEITVTDTATGQSRTYRNPQGTAFLPIQDTNAFASCDNGQGNGTAAARVSAEAASLAETLERLQNEGSAAIPEISALELNDDRFRVEVTWETSQGTSGEGMPGRLTDDTGWFWFFDPDNVETVVKVLDACPFADHFWVFAAGLTNVAVEITVTDTKSGQSKTYRNPQGSAFLPIQDTSAFATCP